jgi:hypothetical protein
MNPRRREYKAHSRIEDAPLRPKMSPTRKQRKRAVMKRWRMQSPTAKIRS